MDEFLFNDPYELGPPLEPARPRLEYPPTLPRDLALFPEKLEGVLEANNTSHDELTLLMTNTVFRKELAEWQRKVVEENYGVTARAEVLVKQGLQDLQDAMRDVDVGVETKLKIQNYFATLAGLMNKKEAVQQNNAPQVNIQINL